MISSVQETPVRAFTGREYLPHFYTTGHRGDKRHTYLVTHLINPFPDEGANGLSAGECKRNEGEERWDADVVGHV